MRSVGSLIIVLFAFYSVQAIADDAVGKITKLRATTSDHPDSAWQNKMVFQIDSSLVNCTWLSVGANEKIFVSAALSAEAKNQEVRIWYSSDTCKAYTLELR